MQLHISTSNFCSYLHNFLTRQKPSQNCYHTQYYTESCSDTRSVWFAASCRLTTISCESGCIGRSLYMMSGKEFFVTWALWQKLTFVSIICSSWYFLLTFLDSGWRNCGGSCCRIRQALLDKQIPQETPNHRRREACPRTGTTKLWTTGGKS